jgi:hypothetical protein
VDAMAFYIAQCLAQHPEARGLTPKQIQDALAVTLKVRPLASARCSHTAANLVVTIWIPSAAGKPWIGQWLERLQAHLSKVTCCGLLNTPLPYFAACHSLSFRV